MLQWQFDLRIVTVWDLCIVSISSANIITMQLHCPCFTTTGQRHDYGGTGVGGGIFSEGSFEMMRPDLYLNVWPTWWDQDTWVGDSLSHFNWLKIRMPLKWSDSSSTALVCFFGCLARCWCCLWNVSLGSVATWKLAAVPMCALLTQQRQKINRQKSGTAS